MYNKNLQIEYENSGINRLSWLQATGEGECIYIELMILTLTIIIIWFTILV